MTIESLMYRPIFGGLRHGLMGLELRLGDDGPNFSNAELIRKIMDSAAAYSQQSRVLTVTDKRAVRVDNSEALELVSSLKDTFEVTAEVTGYSKPGWVAPGVVTRTRAFINDEDWLLFKADEIFYIPNDPENIKPPQVGPANMNALRYIVIPHKLKHPKNLIDIVRGAALVWMVLSRPIFTVEVQLL